MGVIVVGLAVCGLVWLFFVAESPQPSAQGGGAGQAADPPPAGGPLVAEAPSAARPLPRTVEGDGFAPPSPSKRPFPLPENRVAAEERARLLEAIRAGLDARARRAAPAPTAPQAPPEEARGSLQREYIQAAVREIVPLIRECYENALSEDPTVQGKLVVRFEVVADEEHGGLIAQSEVVPEQGRPAPSASLAECVQESMYALRLDAPAGGGTVTVTYPFVFRTEE
jgi:hypothetical protein